MAGFLRHEIRYEVNGTQGSTMILARDDEAALAEFHEEWAKNGDHFTGSAWVTARWSQDTVTECTEFSNPMWPCSCDHCTAQRETSELVEEELVDGCGCELCGRRLPDGCDAELCDHCIRSERGAHHYRGGL